MGIEDTIRTAREKHGWTRAQLSEKVGVDPSAISRIECGDRLPGPDVADTLESALGLRKGTLSNAVIAEKKKKRDRISQLKRLVYNSRASRKFDEGSARVILSRTNEVNSVFQSRFDSNACNFCDCYLFRVHGFPFLFDLVYV